MKTIRFVRQSDIPELLKIYAQYIDTPISFEYGLPSLKEFSERARMISSEYPYFVCEENGELLGYAYAHKFFERAAYQWDVEMTIYLSQKSVGKGVGKCLYNLLFEILKLQNVINLYALVTVGNTASEAFHRALGFHATAVSRKTGFKCGAWQDVTWFEKQLGPFPDSPQPFLLLGQVSPESIKKAGECLPQGFLFLPEK